MRSGGRVGGMERGVGWVGKGESGGWDGERGEL